MEAVEQTFNTQVSFGGDLQINLNRNGDLIYFMYLQVTLPGITAVQRVDAGAQLQVDLPQHRVSIASQQPAERFVAALTEEGYPPA